MRLIAQLMLSSLLVLGCREEPHYCPTVSAEPRLEYRNNLTPECFSVVAKDGANRSTADEVTVSFSQQAPFLSGRDRVDLEAYVSHFGQARKLYVRSNSSFREQAGCVEQYLRFVGGTRFGEEVQIERQHVEGYKGVKVSHQVVAGPQVKAKRNPTIPSKQHRTSTREKASDVPPLTQSQFYNLIRQDRPTVVNFYSPGCGACKHFAPTFEATRDQYERQAAFGRINIREEAGLWTNQNIKATPTIVVYHRGKEQGRIQGFSRIRFPRQLDQILDSIH